jgi:ferrous iron transport protein B
MSDETPDADPGEGIATSPKRSRSDAPKHSRSDAQRTDTPYLAALVGTISVGKSVIFDNACSIRGREDRVLSGGAFTVPTGRLQTKLLGTGDPGTRVVDTPGISSLFADGEDGMITRRLLLDGDVDALIFVADGQNLRRSLVLALQVAEFGLPMCGVVNLMDMARSRGIEVAEEALAARLGIPIQLAVASERRGLDEFVELLGDARVPRVEVAFPRAIDETLQRIARLLEGGAVSTRGLAILLLGGDPEARKLVEDCWGRGMVERIDTLVGALTEELNRPLDVVLTEAYSTVAERIVAETVQVRRRSPPFMERFGIWSQSLATGIPIALAVLVAMYYFVGAFGATYLVDLLNAKLFKGVLVPLFNDAVQPIPSAFVRGALVDPHFGVLTTGLFLAVGIVLPVLFCFYLFFGVLEESGYLPRFSVLLHQALRRIGLTGKGVVPLIMGCSCVTMALLTTRMLDTRKEKLIASFLLILAMPCAPLIAVMFVILGRMPAYASAFVFGFLFVQVVIAGWLANRLIPGRPAELILELPPMRVPSPLSIVVSSWRRTWAFMKEAMPWFLIAAFVIFVIHWLGGLQVLERGARPLMGGLLGMPDNSVQVFMKTIIRREAGAAELDRLRSGYTNLQLVISLLVMTLLLPCVNSLVVLFKERGLKASALMLLSSTAYALIAGGVVNQVCSLLGVTFG